MRYRKLRFAWSVFWGLATVLLIALWVRSYTWMDVLGISTRSALMTGTGELSIVVNNSGAHAKVGELNSVRRSGQPMISDVWRKNRTWNLYALYGSEINKFISIVAIELPALVITFGSFA